MEATRFSELVKEVERDIENVADATGKSLRFLSNTSDEAIKGEFKANFESSNINARMDELNSIYYQGLEGLEEEINQAIRSYEKLGSLWKEAVFIGI